MHFVVSLVFAVETIIHPVMEIVRQMRSKQREHMAMIVFHQNILKMLVRKYQIAFSFRDKVINFSCGKFFEFLPKPLNPNIYFTSA